jgi:hypothetical protein
MAPMNDDEIGRVLGGSGNRDDVARLFEAMRAPAHPAELANAAHVVDTITEVIRSNPTPMHSRRRPMVSKLLTTKAIGIAAVVLAGGTAAAASTGSLPAPAQAAVSNALAHVDVSIPNPHAHHHNNGRGSDNVGGAKGPDATGDAKYGLCTAWAAGSDTGHAHKANSVAFTNLQNAAKAAHQTVAAYCKDVKPAPEPHTTTTTVGAHTPPVSTPNRGAGNPDHQPNANSAGHGSQGSDHSGGRP